MRTHAVFIELSHNQRPLMVRTGSLVDCLRYAGDKNKLQHAQYGNQPVDEIAGLVCFRYVEPLGGPSEVAL